MTVSAPDLSAPGSETYIQSGLEVVERHFRKAVSGLHDPVDRFISHLTPVSGKRLHPVFTLMCTQFGNLVRTPDEAVITGATAAGLIHLVSLYRGDVMDSASVRRGAPSAQRLWDNDRAILAGDVSFAYALVLAAALSPEMVSHHVRTFERPCIGQLNETLGPEEGQDRVGFYIKVLANKTGSLATTAAHFDARLPGVGGEITVIVSELGGYIGVAFQITSDAIGLVSDGGASGRTPGINSREGVDILLMLLLKRCLAQGTIDEDGRRTLGALDSDLSSNEAPAELVAALRRHEVLEETRQMAKDWSMRMIKTPEPLPEGEAKTALIAFAHLMVDRLA